MAFDPSTAKPEPTGFDISSARPEVDTQKPFGQKSALEKAQDIGGAVLNIATSIPATIAGGVAGTITSLIPGAEPGSGAAVARGVQERLTTEFEGGEKLVQGFAQSVIDTIKENASPGVLKAGKFTAETFKSADQAILENFGPEVATVVKTLVIGLPEAGGLILSGGAVSPIIAGLKSGVKSGVKKVFTSQSPAKQKIIEQIESGSTDVSTARFKIEEGKLVGDKAAKGAIKQGFDKGVVADIKQSTPQTKAKMQKMVSLMERGKANARFAVENRASDVAGDSLLNRFRVVRNANRKAGRELDGVAQSLKGQRVDASPAVNEFLSDLESMGISLDDRLRPIFKGSDIEGLAAPEAAIKRIVSRMASSDAGVVPDAFELHRLKRFIDENVTFGKGGEGLSGKTEIILKNLRRNLDQTLDANFPEYNRVNTAYSETIGVIDALQDVAGKKMNLTGKNADKAAGTLMRRLMSNAQSRVPLMDSIADIEAIARKHGGKFDDDLLSQVLFVDELDAVFKPVARTSFQGQIAQALPTSKADLIAKGAKKGLDVVTGVNEEAAFKAIKLLLKKE